MRQNIFAMSSAVHSPPYHCSQKLGRATLSFPNLWSRIKYNLLGSLQGHTAVLGAGVAVSVRGRLNDAGGGHTTHKNINASEEGDVFLSAMRSQGLPQSNASRSIPVAFFTHTNVRTIICPARTTFGQMLTNWWPPSKVEEFPRVVQEVTKKLQFCNSSQIKCWAHYFLRFSFSALSSKQKFR
jgi:hypothetical protein